MKMADIGFLKTEPTSKFKNWKLGFRGFVFKNRHRQFGDGFSRCLIHNSSCSMIGSTVEVFFFMPYLCTSSSKSLRLTISWTNSARKCVISSVIPQRHKWKTASTSTDECRPNRTKKTKPRLILYNRKRTKNPVFAKPNWSHFLPTAHP